MPIFSELLVFVAPRWTGLHRNRSHDESI